MSIGMKYQTYEDCEVTCCICGRHDKLVLTVFRNRDDKVIGYLFTCNKECFDYLQKSGIVVEGTETKSVLVSAVSYPEGNTSISTVSTGEGSMP